MAIVAAISDARRANGGVWRESSRDGSDFGPLVARSGARGFVPKGELSGELIAALIE